MKDSTHNMLVALIMTAMLVCFIIFMVISFNSEAEKHDNICKKIAIANNFKFLFQSHGDCGAGEDCSYQCRFVDTNGRQVTRNVK